MSSWLEGRYLPITSLAQLERELELEHGYNEWFREELIGLHKLSNMAKDRGSERSNWAHHILWRKRIGIIDESRMLGAQRIKMLEMKRAELEAIESGNISA